MIALGILGVAAVGIAIYFSRSYLSLLVLLGLMGVLGGGYHPASPPLVCAAAARERRGLALGTHAVGGSAAFFIAPLVVAVTAGVWGWRASYLCLAIPSLIFGFILYAALRRFNQGERSAFPLVSASTLTNINPGSFALFISLSALGSVAMVLVVAYLPLLLVDKLNINEGSAAALLAVVYLTGIFANIGVGFLTDNFSRRGILVASLLTSAAAVAVLSSIPNMWSIVILLVLFGFLIVVFQNVAESFLMTHVTAERASSILGLYYFATMTGSGLLTPLLGALIDWRGFGVGLGLLAVGLGLAGIGYIFLKRR